MPWRIRRAKGQIGPQRDNRDQQRGDYDDRGDRGYERRGDYDRRDDRGGRSRGNLAVDVFRNEPPSPEDPLLNHPRVLVTPHIAWGTEDAVKHLLDGSIENVEAFLAGKPINVVS